MDQAYILAAFRTPGCKAQKGKFKDFRPDDLAAITIKETIRRSAINPEEIDDVILGCAFPEGEQGMNVARIALLKAGLSYKIPAMTINRFCASGLQSVALAAERIIAGKANCILAGGTESMTMIPMGGQRYSANPGLVKSWPETYACMGITAELVAEKHKISREAQDIFAFESHCKAAKAIESGRFKKEIIPVEIESATMVNDKISYKKEIVNYDDGVRSDTTVEKLTALKPAFRQNGTVTAGNASQMTDGAALVVVVSEAFIKKYNLQPLARFVEFQVIGVPPEIMGIGPIEAVPLSLKKAGLKLNDIGLIELNEAFAAQSLAVINELKLNSEVINVSGGAIALGHPLGCTGAKLTATLLHEMKRMDIQYGMVTMCVGGGMGAAGIYEKV